MGLRVGHRSAAGPLEGVLGHLPRQLHALGQPPCRLLLDTCPALHPGDGPTLMTVLYSSRSNMGCSEVMITRTRGLPA